MIRISARVTIEERFPQSAFFAHVVLTQSSHYLSFVINIETDHSCFAIAMKHVRRRLSLLPERLNTVSEPP